MTLYFFALFTWEEAILHLFCAQGAFGWGMLFAPLMALPAAFLLGAACSCFQKKGNRRLARICAVIILVAYGSQLVYFAVFRTYYTLFSAAHGAQVLEFLPVIAATILKRAPYLLAMAAGILPVTLCRPPLLTFPHAGKRRVLAGVLAALAAQLLAMGGAALTPAVQNSPRTLYYNTRVLTASVDNLGLYTTLRHDFTDAVFGFEASGSGTVSAGGLIMGSYSGDSAASGSSSDSADSADSAADSTPADTVPREPNVLNIDFDALAASEQDSTIADMDRYFASVEPTYTNEMTGLFKGKNLIFVVAESFSPYAIDAERTPTLYKMQHDGFNFTHFYTGIWGVSTLDGEYVADMGLIPQQNVWSMYETRHNALPFTLGNQFLRLGYNTYAYHDGLYDYYSRNISHPHLGYEVYKGVNGGLTMTGEWPRSDEEMIDITTDEYIHDDAFHVYYMTISGHLPYSNSSGDAQAHKNWAAVENLPYTEPVKAYLAANMELDKAMKLLLDRLQAAGKLDDTVIVLSPDHYPYGLTNEEISEMAGHTVDTDFELYKSCLLIYNAATPGRTVTKYASSLDILPTVSNLFGLPFDSRLFSGRDIFSDASPLVMLVDHSFITDKVMYAAASGKVTPLTQAAADKDFLAQYISDTAKEVDDKFNYARKILQYDYYSHLPEDAFDTAAAGAASSGTAASGSGAGADGTADSGAAAGSGGAAQSAAAQSNAAVSSAASAPAAGSAGAAG